MGVGSGWRRKCVDRQGRWLHSPEEVLDATARAPKMTVTACLIVCASHHNKNTFKEEKKRDGVLLRGGASA